MDFAFGEKAPKLDPLSKVVCPDSQKHFWFFLSSGVLFHNASCKDILIVELTFYTVFKSFLVM